MVYENKCSYNVKCVVTKCIDFTLIITERNHHYREKSLSQTLNY